MSNFRGAGKNSRRLPEVAVRMIDDFSRPFFPPFFSMSKYHQIFMKLDIRVVWMNTQSFFFIFFFENHSRSPPVAVGRNSVLVEETGLTFLNKPKSCLFWYYGRTLAHEPKTCLFFFAYNLRMERGTVLILTSLSAQCQYL